MRYAWIVEHRASYAIATMCDVLSVSRSGLYGAMQRARATTKARESRRFVARSAATVAATGAGG
ncbi:MAG: hypothetical protein M9885_09460 [Burkholderiaceae bacterium]|nr:hypothetical protein [Burkholderiaceae bacterium]